MRKVFALLLVMAYLIPSVGVSVSAHYCEDKLDSITLGNADENDCPCEAESIDNDCCKDITIIINSNDNKHIAVPLAINYLKEAGKQIPVCITKIYYNKPLSAVNIYSNYLHPPSCNNEQPLYLSNQVFRI